MTNFHYLKGHSLGVAPRCKRLDTSCYDPFSSVHKTSIMEIWKDIPAVEPHIGSYQISNGGGVRSLKSGYPKLLHQYVPTDRYPTIALRINGQKKNYLVHRLVAQAFIPNPENKPNVNHLNAIKTDNRVENLEWCTQAENLTHSLNLKSRKLGEKHSWAKLTNREVEEIRCLYGCCFTQYRLADMYGVAQSHISRIVNYKERKRC